MDESSSDFRATLLKLIEAYPEPMEHPSPDRWLAYHRGELSADEETRLQEHLVRCPDCFDLAQAAAAFAQEDDKPGTGQEVDTAALWRLLRPQLGPTPEPAPHNVHQISAVPSKLPARASRLPMALAALFFVALVGLTAWNLQLRAPRPNLPIFDFAAGERALEGQERTVPAGPRMFVFHPAEELPAYRLAIRDAATGRELSSHELRPDEDLALTLYLPGLRPGRYRMEISDGSNGRALETHLLRVTEPGQGD